MRKERGGETRVKGGKEGGEEVWWRGGKGKGGEGKGKGWGMRGMLSCQLDLALNICRQTIAKYHI